MGDSSSRTDLSEQVPGQRAELRTFLIADIRGYTTFTADRGDEAAAKLAGKFARVAREAVETREGTVLELRGDEAVCVFVSPRQALLAAIDLQDRLVEETAADTSLPLPAGIGLDVGEVVPIEGGYRGGALNMAARLCGIAKAGEVLASPEVIHLAGKLDSITYVERGAVSLKGLAVPVRVMKVVSDAQDHVAQLAPYAPRPSHPSRVRGPRWLPPVLAGRRGIAFAVAVVLVAAVVPLAISKIGGKGLAGLAANSIGVIDSSGKITDQIAVGQNPAHIAADADAIWVTNEIDDTVSRIDPKTNAPIDTIQVGNSPSGVAIGFGAVWVANSLDGTVSRIAPETGQVVDTIRNGNGPDGIAAGQDAIWVADLLDGTVARIDPRTDQVSDTISVGGGPTEVAVGEGSVWATLFQQGEVVRVDPTIKRVVKTISVGDGPNGIGVNETGVWVANSLSNTISRIDPATNAESNTIPVGEGPDGVAVGASDIWVSDEYGKSVDRIHVGSLHVDRIPIGSRVAGITSGPSGFLVAARESGEGHRGGIVTAFEPFSIGKGTGSALDPGLAWVGWAEPYVADGLVAFKKTDGVENNLLVPDLASDLPEISPDGRTYTFQMRKGVSYSDGKPLHATDVRYTIERMFRLGSWPVFSGWLTQIQGADACLDQPDPCDLSQGIETSDASMTVTFHLAKPDAGFLYQLAYTYLVPYGTPERDLEGPKAFAPGTGPYRIESYREPKIGRKQKPDEPGVLRLVRNPHFNEWSKAARPDGYPEEIRAKFLPPNDQNDTDADARAIKAVANGQADFAPVGGFLTPVHPSWFESIDLRFPGQVHSHPLPGSVSLTLDPKRPPFNDPRARQALSYALDRNKIAELSGSLPWCQFLPANFPGYVPYCPYTVDPSSSGRYEGPDLQKAEELVRRSGTRGESVVVDWTNNGFPIPEVGSYLVEVLNDLGYQARLHWVDATQCCDNITGNIGSATGFSYDYPLASEFVSGQIGCGFLPPYCDPSVKAATAKAQALESTDLAAANRQWARIDRQVVDDAIFIPIYQPVFTLIVSKRVHNFQAGNNEILKDQFWVS